MATGYFLQPQAREAERMLAETRGLYRVILIHHPPLRSGPLHRRLIGVRRFRDMIARQGAELVLHGHTHLPTLHWLPGAYGPVPVVGVAAAGQAPGAVKPAAQYNLFEIEERQGNWHARLTRYGLGEGQAAIPVEQCWLSGGAA